MNEYLVIWTYVANHGTLTVTAESAAAASEIVFRGFSEDFRARGTCYVVLKEHVSEFTNKHALR